MVKTLKYMVIRSEVSIYSTMESIWKLTRKDVTILGKLGPISESDKIRIVDKTIYTDLDSCWFWNGTKQYNGKGHKHGCIWYNRKYVQIHRLMFHNFIQDVPIFERKKDSLQVNHKCDTDGQCINPHHMYLGTPKENTKDCFELGNKNKAASGEKNPNATLSNEIVQEIKNLKGNTDKSQKSIALEYGVNQSQISRWWNNKTR